jgi:hypothetical protein
MLEHAVVSSAIEIRRSGWLLLLLLLLLLQSRQRCHWSPLPSSTIVHRPLLSVRVTGLLYHVRLTM